MVKWMSLFHMHCGEDTSGNSFPKGDDDDVFMIQFNALYRLVKITWIIGMKKRKKWTLNIFKYFPIRLKQFLHFYAEATLEL